MRAEDITCSSNRYEDTYSGSPTGGLSLSDMLANNLAGDAPRSGILASNLDGEAPLTNILASSLVGGVSPSVALASCPAGDMPLSGMLASEPFGDTSLSSALTSGLDGKPSTSGPQSNEQPKELLLSHESALEFHRKLRVANALGKPYPGLAEIPRLPNGGVAIKELAHELELPTPIRLAVPSERGRFGSDYARCRIVRPEVPGIQLCPGLSVVSPEEALFQICEKKAPMRQMILAYELCGSFAICPGSEDGFINDLDPITTPQLLLEHELTKAGNRDSPRFRIHRKVLSSIVAGAASPAEAKLCLAIVAPRYLGGQGLPKPELNVEIRVEGSALGLTRRLIIRPDMYWKKYRIILEYMGSRHASEARMGEDASRDNALNAMGYKVIHVTKRQLQDPRLYQGLMNLLRKELGVRSYIPSQEMLEKQEALRSSLFGASIDLWH